MVPLDTKPRAESIETGGLFRALRSRNFTILWVGNLLANTGTWMQQVAEPWLVLRLSNSPFLVGLDAFMTDGPIWLLILAGGIIADRRDRRRTALLFQGIQLLCPVLLVLLLALGRVQVWMVLALSLVVGVTDALSGPSVNALVPASVPEEDVPSAVALNSAQFNLSRVLGPFLAGGVMASLGAIACFAINAASYVPYLAALYLLKLPSRPAHLPPPERSRKAARESLIEGVMAVARRKRLRSALLPVIVTSLFTMPIVTFIPVLVRDGFHLGTSEFGGALSVFGIGGIFGAALVLFAKTNRQRQRVCSFAAATVSALVIAAATFRLFPLVLVTLFATGATLVATTTAANSILQSSIDTRLRGRVSSIFTLALRGGAPLGSLLTGAMATRFDIRTALVLDGLLGLACHAMLLLARRGAWNAKRVTF